MTAPAHERGIIFGAESVRAILDGRKTQTRRVVAARRFDADDIDEDNGRNGWGTIRPGDNWTAEEVVREFPNRFGVAGDCLWVRETWQAFDPVPMRFGGAGALAGASMRIYANPPIRDVSLIEYASDQQRRRSGWRSPLHMPRWVSRLTLEITAIRVERVQDISTADAQAEGCDADCACGQYRALWDSLNAQRGYPWVSNPWVWVIAFRRLDGAS